METESVDTFLRRKMREHEEKMQREKRTDLILGFFFFLAIAVLSYFIFKF